MSNKLKKIRRLAVILLYACCIVLGCKSPALKGREGYAYFDRNLPENPFTPQPTEQALSERLSPLGVPLKPEEIERPKADEIFDESGTIIKAKNRMPEGPMPFYSYLNVMWRKFGCFFTIERLRNEGDSPTRLEFDSVIKNDLEIESIDSLIAKLQQEFPGCEIVPDAKNPKILHLMDGRLKNLKTYAMDQKTTLRFKGPLGNLPIALGKRVEGVSSYVPSNGMSPPPLDETLVHIKEKDCEIRKLLTDHIPLKNRYILWISETTVEGGKARTSLLFSM